MLERKKVKTLRAQAKGGLVELRHPRWADFEDWTELRRENQAFLKPWEPNWSESHLTRNAYKNRIIQYNRMVDQGTGFPFHIFAGSELRFIGACNITQIQREPASSARIGYWIGESFARQGFARAAVRAALKFCFDDLGIHRVEAAVQKNNHRSIKLLEALSFTHEGCARGFLKINGRWRDHEVYSRLSSD